MNKMQNNSRSSEIVKKAKIAFDMGKTRQYTFRRSQLQNLLKLIDENIDDICEALFKDLRKSRYDAIVTEINVVIFEIRYALHNLKDWMKPKYPEKDFLSLLNEVKILNDPCGVVLVMGSWTFPLKLNLLPVIGAIAAGNCLIIKPSDASPHSAELLSKLVPQYLDGDCYHVYLGDVEQTKLLLKERFDHIFYIGNLQFGKVVHQYANQYLTPTTLNLEGKCPVYIDESADIEKATRRILWGKFLNAGQANMSPDYILCSKSVEKNFLNCASNVLKEFFEDNVRMSPDFNRIVNEEQCKRLCNLLANQKIAHGGNFDHKERFIQPTILTDVDPDDDIMQEVILGPILPIIHINNVREAINFIRQRGKPLAIYIFSKNKSHVNLILEKTSSGGVTVNDTFLHAITNSLPLGGVGSSGMGSYHGKYSFDTFTHRKSVFVSDFGKIKEKFNHLRYPPLTDLKVTLLSQIMTKTTLVTSRNLTYFSIGLSTLICIISVLFYVSIFELVIKI